jgi:hypothetical protein
MRVLIGCETSGRVRNAFLALGHDAWSVDLLPSEDRSHRHIIGDVFDVANDRWDMGIFHPDCTYLTVSAAWAYKDPDFSRYPGVGYHQKVSPDTLTGAARREAREKALEFFRRIEFLPYPLAIENPAPSFISTAHRAPDQIIQPYHFGDDASKSTGLWLKGLRPLRPTNMVWGRLVEWPPGSCRTVWRWGNQTDSGQNRLTPGPGRWKERARTYPGIADAMARQWGGI